MSDGSVAAEAAITLDPAAPDDSSARPQASARMLGEKLREHRRKNGLPLRRVADVIRGSVSKVSRMERGESPPKERDVRDLMIFYNLQGEDAHELETLLRQAQDSAWWQQYSDVTPNWLKRLIGLEASAAEIRSYETHVVPGLLQTPEYARSLVLTAFPNASEAEIDRRVRLRLERQRVIRGSRRPDMLALLDEGILKRPVGGAAVMADQLDHLLESTGPGTGVRVRVVSFERSASAAPSYPITFLAFDPSGPSDLVYVELINSAMYLSKAAEVERYRHVLLNLLKAAENRETSLEMLRSARDEYRAEAATSDD